LQSEVQVVEVQFAVPGAPTPPTSHSSLPSTCPLPHPWAIVHVAFSQRANMPPGQSLAVRQLTHVLRDVSQCLFFEEQSLSPTHSTHFPASLHTPGVPPFEHDRPASVLAQHADWLMHMPPHSFELALHSQVFFDASHTFPPLQSLDVQHESTGMHRLLHAL
jgi:hypothetical protein